MSEITPVRIAFICTHNACRSILCEVIARELGRGRIETASAGASPRGVVHPQTIDYLASRGYATSGLASKGFEALEEFDPEVVITVCDNAANEACPVWMGRALKVHWGLPDPTAGDRTKEETHAAFDEVCARLEARVNEWLDASIESLDRSGIEALLTQ